MLTDLMGETSCLHCGYAGPVYAADSEVGRAIPPEARQTTSHRAKVELEAV